MLYFLTGSALVAVNFRENKRITVEKNSNRILTLRKRDTYINSTEINEILSIHFDKHEKNTCGNISGMNAMFDIPYKSRLSVKL